MQQTSTRLFDWIDYIAIKETDSVLTQLQNAGFVQQAECDQHIFVHPGAQLPRVLLQRTDTEELGLGVIVDSISDFLMVRGVRRPVEGTIFGPFRRCLYSSKNRVSLWIVERKRDPLASSSRRFARTNRRTL